MKVIEGGHATFLVGKDMSFFSKDAMEFIKKYTPTQKQNPIKFPKNMKIKQLKIAGKEIKLKHKDVQTVSNTNNIMAPMDKDEMNDIGTPINKIYSKACE